MSLERNSNWNKKKENSSNVECNVVTLPIEFMAKQNITEDEELNSKGSNA